MKRILLTLAAAAALLSACNGTKSNLDSVEKPSSFEDEAYFGSLNSLYEDMPLYSDNIVMVGDDFIAGGNWSEFYADTTVKNRGIKYDCTEHVLYRIDKIAAAKPAKIFVSAGYNDIRTGKSVESAKANIETIFQRIAAISPETERCYINVCFNAGEAGRLNEEIKALAERGGFKYIDVASVLENGLESGKFGSLAGMLNGAGYAALAECLEPYIGKKSTLNAGASGKSGDYGDNRADMFACLENIPGKIVIAGDDFIEHGPWTDLFPFSPVVCRGIASDKIQDVTDRIEEFAADVPSKLFIMVGANDIEDHTGDTIASIWESYQQLLIKLQLAFPNTTVYVMSVLPKTKAASDAPLFNAKAKELNRLLSVADDYFDYIYIDLAALVTGFDGFLVEGYSIDGKTMNAEGYYRIAADLIKGARFISLNIPR